MKMFCWTLLQQSWHQTSFQSTWDEENYTVQWIGRFVICLVCLFVSIRWGSVTRHDIVQLCCLFRTFVGFCYSRVDIKHLFSQLEKRETTQWVGRLFQYVFLFVSTRWSSLTKLDSPTCDLVLFFNDKDGPLVGLYYSKLTSNIVSVNLRKTTQWVWRLFQYVLFVCFYKVSWPEWAC